MQTNEIKSPSPFLTFLKKFRRQRVAVVSLGVLIVIVFIGMFAQWLVPFDPHRPVTDQYAEKGIEVNQLARVTLPLSLVMSDGSKKTGSDLGEVTLESEDRQIAAGRNTENGVFINASGDGTTAIEVSASGLTSRIKVVVSAQDNGQTYLSQLIAHPPQQPLKPGESVKADVSAVLTDASELAGLEKVVAFAEQHMAIAASQPATSNGFSNSSATTEAKAMAFESLDPAVVQVGDDGTINAVADGSTAVKVTVDGVTTLIPVSVNQPLAEPMPIRLEPGQLQVDLINAFKHQPPSSLHWFGTDHQNRDILSRVLMGTRETLLIGFVSVAIGAVIGTVLGLIAGYYGGRIDSLITRFTDVLLAFPGILLAIAVIALLGPGITNIIFAVAVFTVPIFIRIVRGSALALKEMTYVEAARSIGVRDSVIVARHIFPGTISVVIVYLTMRMGTAILIGAALSFLGLGGDITAPEWGAMLSAAKDNSRNLFHPTFFPGLAIVVTVLCFNLLGDGLRDALDPKLKD